MPSDASEDASVVVLRYNALEVVMAFRLCVVLAFDPKDGAEVAALGVWKTVVVLIVASGHDAGSIGTALETTTCLTGAVVLSAVNGLEGVYNDTCVTVMVIFDWYSVTQMMSGQVLAAGAVSDCTRIAIIMITKIDFMLKDRIVQSRSCVVS